MNAAAPRVRPLTDLLRLFVPPVVWFAHFTIVYGSEALICTPPVNSPTAMTWVGIIATIAALGALAAFALAHSRPAERAEHQSARFVQRTTLLLSFLSAVAVIWTAFPVVLISVCIPPAV